MRGRSTRGPRTPGAPPTVTGRIRRDSRRVTVPFMAPRTGLAAVSAALLAMNRTLEVRDVLQTIVGSARELLSARYAALGVPDGHGGFAQFIVDGVSDRQWQAIGPLPRQHGVLAAMLDGATPVRLGDVRHHPDFEGWPSAHPELTDFLGMPIIDGDEILGELFLANKNAPGGFTADDEELAQLLAVHAAIALVNARLYERSRELFVLEERHRIARELHDSVTQKLFSLRLTADATATLLRREPDRAAAQLDTVRQLAAAATDDLRAIVVGLQPADLAGDGLHVALRKQAELLDRVHGAEVHFRGCPIPRMAGGRAEAVYRIAQEALHNALRHAAPQRVEIDLSSREGVLLLEISDDGRGFDPGSASTHARRRLGLASMRDRARAAGGRLTVESRPGRGTTVRLAVPLA
jgi:signal transduction histidine kinase